MTLGAFVTTFRRPEVLRDALDRILSQTVPPEAVLVIDNGDCTETEAVTRSFAHRGVEYRPSGDNLGPAGGAAAGVAWGVEQGFDWLYWGDDDDPPSRPDVFERLIAVAERAPQPAGAGALGARWSWASGTFVRIADDELRGSVPVDVIAGGGQLLLYLPNARAVAPPDAQLFFEFEDLDYCLRLRAAGLDLLVDGDLMLAAREGTGRLGPVRRRRLVPPHDEASLWRRYYTTRNYVYLMAYRFARPDLARREVAKAVLRALASWLRGPRYGVRFTQLECLAVRDGLRGRLGRTVAPGPTRPAASSEEEPE